jgi:Domain of unknown function (DUF1876)
MSTTKRWMVEILLSEEDVGTTQAVARLDTSEDAHLQGRGTWRGPSNTDDSKIGDNIAVAKALSQIAAKLSAAATGDSDGSTRAAWARLPTRASM